MTRRAQPVQPERLYSEDEVAERFRARPATVRYWRYVGTGPAFIKVGGKGGRVLYREADLLAYEDANRHVPAASA
jgi:hypothetical protein